MTEKRTADYRALVGLQLQFADQGDNDRVMDLQEVLEKWIANRVKEDITLALAEMKASPVREIICNLNLDEIAAYRKIQGDGMMIAFHQDGFEGMRGLEDWKVYQVSRAELFVEGLIEQRVLDAVKPFLTMRVN